MTTANRVIKNTGILYAKMGITMFISLYTTRLILNALGVADFGIFNIVGGAIAMLGFLNAAMAGATQRFMSYAEGEGNKDKQKSIFNVSVVLHFFIALLVGIALLIAGYFFFNGILNIPADRMYAAHMVYYFMIISTMLTVMTVPYDAVLNAHENMLYYAIVGIIESVLKLGVALVVVYTLADKLMVYGALMAGISLTVMIIMRIYCHKHYVECEFAPRKHWNKGLMKEMSNYAGWSFLDASSGIISQYGLGIVLNHFFGAILNAAQGIANQIGGQLMIFSRNMLKALNPVIVKNEGAGNRVLMLKASIMGCRFSYFLLAFLAIPFMIETPYIFKIWLKEVPEWAVVFCRLQLVRSLFEQLSINLWASISAQGQIKQFYMYKSVLNILPMLLTFLCFQYGLQPYWLYIVWIICWGILEGILIVYFAHKLCNLSIATFLKLVIMPCCLLTIGVSVVGCIPYFFFEESFIRFILTILICTTTFFILFWSFLEKQEKKMIFQIIQKIKTITRKTNNG